MNTRCILFFAFLILAVPVLGAELLPPASTTEGYVARLLVNEVPFPGERGYRSEADTMAAMEQLLMVLDGRLENVPDPYSQQQIAATAADDLIDVITVGGVKGQFDGFYRDDQGRPAMVSRVTERLDNLNRIANQGEPGRFARLLVHAGEITTAYVKDQAAVKDRFAAVKTAEGAAATGKAYSWMSDEVRYHPGGNFLRIEDKDNGGMGGNRFFTLRKDPK